MTSEPLSEEDLRALATSVLDAYRAAGWSEPSTTAVVLHALPVVARIRDEAVAAQAFQDSNTEAALRERIAQEIAMTGDLPTWAVAKAADIIRIALPARPEEDGLVWECGPHANAWGGHDARCRRVPSARPEAARGEGEQ